MNGATSSACSWCREEFTQQACVCCPYEDLPAVLVPAGTCCNDWQTVLYRNRNLSLIVKGVCPSASAVYTNNVVYAGHLLSLGRLGFWYMLGREHLRDQPPVQRTLGTEFPRFSDELPWAATSHICCCFFLAGRSVLSGDPSWERGRRERRERGRGRKKGREGIRKGARGVLQSLTVFSAPYDHTAHPY